MSNQTSLKELERRLYQASIQDGILEIQIGCVFLIFSIAPLLSVHLGDFWSSMIFLPFWIVVLLGTRAFRKNYLQPRIGQIEFGPYRKKRLKTLGIIMLVFNLIAFGMGLLAFIHFDKFPGWVPLSILVLIGFSLGGYLIESPRLYVFGGLTAIAPLVGEYLYRNHGFTHHGFPVTFGFVSISLILTGLILIRSIFRRYPLPDHEDLEW